MTTLALHQNRATLSSKGQVVIPKFLRTLMGLHTGSELIFEVQADKTVLVKPTTRTIEALFHCCTQSSTEPASSINEMDELIGQAILLEDKQGKNEI